MKKSQKVGGKRIFALVLNKSKTASLLQGDLAINTLFFTSSICNELETWKKITGRGYLESFKAKSKTEVGLPQNCFLKNNLCCGLNGTNHVINERRSTKNIFMC